jgi:hypothetical protein
MAEVSVARSAMRDLDRLDANLSEIDLVTAHLEAVLNGRASYAKLLFNDRTDVFFTDVGRFRILFTWPNNLIAFEFQLRR